MRPCVCCYLAALNLAFWQQTTNWLLPLLPQRLEPHLRRPTRLPKPLVVHSTQYDNVLIFLLQLTVLRVFNRICSDVDFLRSSDGREVRIHSI